MENEQMDIIAMTRKLGAMLQQDDRYTAYHLAKQANDQDEDLQKLIGEFNLKRMELNSEMSKPDKDRDKLTALDGKIKEVKVSTRLKDHPVCLSADGPLSIEMEKVLSKQPGSEGVKSDKVLELNVNHPVFAALKAAQEAGDTEKLNKYLSPIHI